MKSFDTAENNVERTNGVSEKVRVALCKAGCVVSSDKSSCKLACEKNGGTIYHG